MKIYKKSIIFLIVTIIVFCFIVCCNNKDEEKSYKPIQKNTFAIYLLADSSISAVDALRVNIKDLSLSSTPLLTISDIISYNWNNHSVVISQNALGRLPTVEDIGVKGIPFVVVVNGKRIYLGAFWNNVSSFSFPNPVIYIGSSKALSFRPSEYSINRAFPSDKFSKGIDLRESPVIKEVMQKSGKIKK